jgi:hypothetical protein
MASTASICYRLFKLDGAVVGAISLSAGVCAEAIVSKFMTRASVKHLLSKKQKKSKEITFGYSGFLAILFLLLTNFVNPAHGMLNGGT